MVTVIKKIYTNSSSVTFDCNGVAIIGNGEFRAISGKLDGFILYSDTLHRDTGFYTQVPFEEGIRLTMDQIKKELS